MLSGIWKTVLFFSSIFVVYLFGLATDMTWMSLGTDMLDYAMAAENFSPAGLGGYPLYILLSSLFIKLPSNNFWDMALLSAIATLVASVFIFLTIKKLSKSELAAYIGSGAYAASFVIWSQSVVPEVYSLTACFGAVALYFVVSRKYLATSVVLAFGLGTHPLIVFFLAPILVYFLYEVGFKQTLRYTAIVSCGFLLFLFQAFAPSVYNIDSRGIVESITITAQVCQGIGAIPIWPLGPLGERLLEFFILVFASFGPLVFLTLFTTVGRIEKLLWSIIILVSLLYLTTIHWQWVTYLSSAFVPLSVLIGLGVVRLPYRRLAYASLALVIVFLGFNLFTYDIGRTVDKNEETTAREFVNSLSEYDSNDILLFTTWSQGYLAARYYSANDNYAPTILFYNCVLIDWSRPKYTKELAKIGIDLPYLENEEPWLDEELLDFITEFSNKNPDRSLYVSYLKEATPAMRFDLISASEYRLELNDCTLKSSTDNER